MLALIVIILLFLAGCSAIKEQACNLPDERSCKHQNFFLIPLCQPEYDNQSNFVRCNPK